LGLVGLLKRCIRGVRKNREKYRKKKGKEEKKLIEKGGGAINSYPRKRKGRKGCKKSNLSQEMRP